MCIQVIFFSLFKILFVFLLFFAFVSNFIGRKLKGHLFFFNFKGGRIPFKYRSRLILNQPRSSLSFRLISLNRNTLVSYLIFYHVIKFPFLTTDLGFGLDYLRPHLLSLLRLKHSPKNLSRE